MRKWSSIFIALVTLVFSSLEARAGDVFLTGVERDDLLFCSDLDHALEAIVVLKEGGTFIDISHQVNDTCLIMDVIVNPIGPPHIVTDDHRRFLVYKVRLIAGVDYDRHLFLSGFFVSGSSTINRVTPTLTPEVRYVVIVDNNYIEL